MTQEGASIPDIDKILLLSQIFGITTDYLLKDDVEVSEEDKESDSNGIKEKPKRHVTRQEATDFFAARKKPHLEWHLVHGCVLFHQL